MPTPKPDDAISAAVQQVLTLFASRAEALRFPDVDHEVLLEHCERVRVRAAELHDAQHALEQAREALSAEQGRLASAAKRGLAYARVYAQNEPGLSDELATFALDAEVRAPRGSAKRKGSAKRPKQQERASGAQQEEPTELPFDEAPSASHSLHGTP